MIFLGRVMLFLRWNRFQFLMGLPRYVATRERGRFRQRFWRLYLREP